MKHIIVIILLISIACAIRQKREALSLSDSSQTIFTGQQVQLNTSSFSPLYMHVFVYQDLGPMSHVNLTDEQKGDVMRIESFEFLEDNGVSVWLARLKKENDFNTYICEIEDALKTKEIILLK